MVRSVPIGAVIQATPENFNEEGYLAANPDVAAAIMNAAFSSGREHFDVFGLTEGRGIREPSPLENMRAVKMATLSPLLRLNLPHEWRNGKVDFLTEDLRKSTKISSTDAVSSNNYDGFGIGLIEAFPEGLVLDCGAGSRSVYYANVINYEIVNYSSTDVIGVGEELPFIDGAFDAVISVAVLEHVRDPFRCAAEISRVLKPGGRLYCSVPFLQPYHGYPHHYFNATGQGIRRLFEDYLDVTAVDVIDSTHPIHALHWIVSSWADGLSGVTREDFLKMKVAELLVAPMTLVRHPFSQELSSEKKMELACATILHAHKPLHDQADPVPA